MICEAFLLLFIRIVTHRPVLIVMLGMQVTRRKTSLLRTKKATIQE